MKKLIALLLIGCLLAPSLAFAQDSSGGDDGADGSTTGDNATALSPTAESVGHAGPPASQGGIGAESNGSGSDTSPDDPSIVRAIITAKKGALGAFISQPPHVVHDSAAAFTYIPQMIATLQTIQKLNLLQQPQMAKLALLIVELRYLWSRYVSAIPSELVSLEDAYATAVASYYGIVTSVVSTLAFLEQQFVITAPRFIPGFVGTGASGAVTGIAGVLAVALGIEAINFTQATLSDPVALQSYMNAETYGLMSLYSPSAVDPATFNPPVQPIINNKQLLLFRPTYQVMQYQVSLTLAAQGNKRSGCSAPPEQDGESYIYTPFPLTACQSAADELCRRFFFAHSYGVGVDPTDSTRITFACVPLPQPIETQPVERAPAPAQVTTPPLGPVTPNPTPAPVAPPAAPPAPPVPAPPPVQPPAAMNRMKTIKENTQSLINSLRKGLGITGD